MRRHGPLVSLTMSASLVGLTALAARAPMAAASDRQAAAVVERMLSKTGGAKAPYLAESIAFTFAVEKDGKTVASRRHVWHPRTGDHQVSGTSKDGAEYRIDWNVGTRKGTATRAGQPVEGDALKEMLDHAWALWVNDTYWLLMPYKLEDPGVHLDYDGEAMADGKTYDKVKVTFDKVGLTPGDTYWAFVARDTGLMERWGFVLEGQKPPMTEFRWLDYGRFGPLTLSARKELVAGGQTIRFLDLQVK